MRNLLIVARYTFTEGIRARFLAGAIAGSVLFLAIGAVLASVPYGKEDFLIARIGWGAVFLTGMLVSVFYAIGALAKERDERILNVMLAKPVGRGIYALGKYAGILGLTAVTVFVEGAVLVALVELLGGWQHDFFWEWLVPSAFITIKCATLLSFAVLFATVFVTPMVAMLLTGGLYIVGIGSEDLVLWAIATENPTVLAVANLIRWLAPQFNVFDVSGWITYDVHMTPAVYAGAVGYFGGYTIIALTFYVIASQIRDLQ